MKQNFESRCRQKCGPKKGQDLEVHLPSIEVIGKFRKRRRTKDLASSGSESWPVLLKFTPL